MSSRLEEAENFRRERDEAWAERDQLQVEVQAALDTMLDGVWLSREDADAVERSIGDVCAEPGSPARSRQLDARDRLRAAREPT